MCKSVSAFCLFYGSVCSPFSDNTVSWLLKLYEKSRNLVVSVLVLSRGVLANVVGRVWFFYFPSVWACNHFDIQLGFCSYSILVFFPNLLTFIFLICKTLNDSKSQNCTERWHLEVSSHPLSTPIPLTYCRELILLVSALSFLCFFWQKLYIKTCDYYMCVYMYKYM